MVPALQDNLPNCFSPVISGKLIFLITLYAQHHMVIQRTAAECTEPDPDHLRLPLIQEKKKKRGTAFPPQLSVVRHWHAIAHRKWILSHSSSKAKAVTARGWHMYAREWRRDRKQSASDADKRKEPNNSEKKKTFRSCRDRLQNARPWFSPDSKSCFRLLVAESVYRSANLIPFVAVLAIFPSWTYFIIWFQLFHHLIK